MKPKTFPQRLSQACDNLAPIIPPYGQGRQVYIANHLKVSQEAVRKWFTGETRPRVAIMHNLAALLQVDEAWLSLGIEPELDRREKRAHGERTEGAVYVLFGLLTMLGGHCAFPGPSDVRAEYVDLYTILQGAQTAVHVSVGREMANGVYQFTVPHQYHEVKTIGVVYQGGARISLLDLSRQLIDAHRKPKSGAFTVTVKRHTNGGYFTDRDEWPRLRDIGEIAL